MSNVPSLKNTEEVFEGILEVTLALIDVFKDGFQLTDATDLYLKISQDDVLLAKLRIAWQDSDKIGSELKNISAVDAIRLANVVLAYVPKIIEKFAKK